MFEDCHTQAEARTEYLRLAKKHHPDLGGNNATMAAINAAYRRFKPRHRNHQTESARNETAANGGYSHRDDSVSAGIKLVVTSLQNKSTAATIRSVYCDMTTCDLENWLAGQCQADSR